MSLSCSRGSVSPRLRSHGPPHAGEPLSQSGQWDVDEGERRVAARGSVITMDACWSFISNHRDDVSPSQAAGRREGHEHVWRRCFLELRTLVTCSSGPCPPDCRGAGTRRPLATIWVILKQNNVATFVQSV